MSRLVKNGKKKPKIREVASSVTRRLPQKDWYAEIRAIFKFVQQHIRYLRDTRGVETVQFPEVTLETGQGDCDDKAVLLAALLESIGHPTRFRAVGFQPGKLSHVFVETRTGDKKQWITLDPTESNGMGWKPKNIVEDMLMFN